MSDRITKSNVDVYVRSTYGEYQNKIYDRIYGIYGLLQNDFEGDMDCTLTSITEITSFYTKENIPEKTIYDNVKLIAKKYGYTDNIGTFSITINKIVNKVNQLYNINRKSRCAYFKGVGYSIKTIMKNIAEKTPVILNMMNDGRDFYKNHTVTIIGVTDYVVNNKHIYMIEIHDNWTTQSSFIDYQKLCLISSINYCK